MPDRTRPQITRLRISNFKSFREAEVDLGGLNVIIGPNASGKSNLVQALKFLKDIADDGLVNAISLQGGVGHLRNIKLGASSETQFEIDVRYPKPPKFTCADETAPRGTFNAKISSATYCFAIKTRKKGGFVVCREELVMSVLPPKSKNNGGIPLAITLRAKNGKLRARAKHQGGTKKMGLLPSNLRFGGKTGDVSLLMLEPSAATPIYRAVKGIKTFNFDPRMAREPTPVKGRAELEEDGQNLPLAIKRILGDSSSRATFLGLVRDLLPSVRNDGTESPENRSPPSGLEDAYFGGGKFQSSMASDGTTSMAALVAALFFESGTATVIEGPERGIHPSLISNVMDLIKDATNGKQIFLTTHSPEVVRFCSLENIVLVKRGKGGYSGIIRPGGSKEVKNFLKHDIGIDEMLADNLLEL